MHLKLEYSMSKDFLQNVLVSAFESGVHGVQSWGSVHEILEGTSSDYTAVLLKYDRKSGEEGSRRGRKKIDLDAVVEGIRRLLTSKRINLGNHYRGQLAAAVINQDAGLIDGPLADCIVQAAIFNDVIYG